MPKIRKTPTSPQAAKRARSRLSAFGFFAFSRRNNNSSCSAHLRHGLGIIFYIAAINKIMFNVCAGTLLKSKENTSSKEDANKIKNQTSGELFNSIFLWLISFWNIFLDKSRSSCVWNDVRRTVDALCVGDGARGAQSIIVLLVAHQRVHSQDRCKNRKTAAMNRG